jgi:hypothetical protein
VSRTKVLFFDKLLKYQTFNILNLRAPSQFDILSAFCLLGSDF